MTAKTDVWMPLVIGAYLADTGHLSTVEHGAYLLLLMTAWTRDGSLPDDDVQLARIVRASPREWKALRPALVGFFAVADGVWTQKRLTVELDRAKAKQAAAQAKAQKAGGTRWGKQGPNDASSIGQASDDNDAPSIGQALPERCPIPIPVSSLRSETKKEPARKKPQPIPQDFAISDRVRAWAARKGFANLDAYLEIFVGRFRASGKQYLDWDETFMNAVREDWYGLRKSPAAMQGRAPTLAERRAANIDRLTGKVRDEPITGTAERVDGAVVRALPRDLWKPNGDDVGGCGPGGGAASVG
jgi:uncharacterized protein YdaU (DUF1376 family)